MDGPEQIQLAQLATEVRLLGVKVTEFYQEHSREHDKLDDQQDDLGLRIGDLEIGQERLASRQGLIAGGLGVFQILGTALAAFLGTRK